MIRKSLSMKRSLFLKIVVLFFLLITSKTLSQSSVTRIYTDWNTYFTSNSATSVVANQPNTENNLLAFDWQGKTYATGANNAVLTANSVKFVNSRFRALKIQSLPYDASSYYLQGSNIDGSLTNRILTPALGGALSTPAELAYRLTDGINGLALGTGIANIKANTLAEFKIGTNNIQIGIIGDGIPDIIVSQVAQPNSVVDKFSFVNAAGVVIGNSVNVDFTSSSIPAVGTYRLDLFNTNNGTPAAGFSANDTRDIRLLAFDLSAFGITDATSSQIDRFVVNFSGSSDCAFIAFNTNSLKLATLALVKKATLLGCGVGGKIRYTFEVTNTGDVPLTNVVVTDPMIGTISGSPIASLAAGATTTLTADYTITAADVALGRVINSAKVTALDPSSNTVEDISGNSIGDDIQTVTNLLTPPTIGTIKNITCNSLGTIALSSLPSGAWTLEINSGSGTVNTSGSGSTTTVTGLAVGTYTFRITDNSSGCKSPLTAPASIISQTTNTWNGTAWSTGSVPTLDQNIVFTGNYPPAVDPNVDLYGCSCRVSGSSTKVTIKTGRTLTITNAVTVDTDENLIFENNASLVQLTNAVNSGKIIYKRDSQPMKNFDFTYWSSPVEGQTLYNLSPNTLWDKYQSYSGSGWKIETSTNVMQPGIGYIIRVPKPFAWPDPTAASYVQPVQFIGKPNNGNITSSQYLQTGKYYLIGNPYPSAIHADDFLKNSHNDPILGGTIYFWTHNTAIKIVNSKLAYVSDDYASYNLTGGVASAPSDPNHAVGTPAVDNGKKPTGFIAAGQSFFVKAEGTAEGYVEFNNSMRYGGTNNTQFFKPGKTSKSAGIEKHRLWLNLTNTGGAFKQTLIGYVEGATNSYDTSFDGISYDGNSYIDFYSISESSNLTIQGRALPFSDSDVVPLGYRSTIAGDFTIAIDEADGSLANQKIYLEDTQTGTINELTAKNYTFTTKAGTFKNRFVLRYKNTTLGTGDFETENDAVWVVSQNKTITVNSTKENIDKVFIYDITGKQLYSKDTTGSLDLIMQNLPFAEQVVLVKVILENGYQTTKKVIFK
ncbi:DUF7507 domain-containing protein [Flavobacterium hibisci]|uniref:DUF7507 domain-containing protein n=1 Tax=Flavobacterium hibisci TaxID=1914462 RepID=UPI001CBF17C4|nr:T9SS sorting signal type C domain-containing protein [Flavobacterium hibisci]MBZ4043343.1 T9SS sorting signal type C domain-containing protein [Flavobacterium hibisci]